MSSGSFATMERALCYGPLISLSASICFRAISRSLARMMDAFRRYRPRMEGVHHVHKLDHPSGTAVTLAEEHRGRM